MSRMSKAVMEKSKKLESKKKFFAKIIKFRIIRKEFNQLAKKFMGI